MPNGYFHSRRFRPEPSHENVSTAGRSPRYARTFAGVLRWVGVYLAGTSGEMIRDTMFECVEQRFRAPRTAYRVQWLTDNVSTTGAKTVDIAPGALNPLAEIAIKRSPQTLLRIMHLHATSVRNSSSAAISVSSRHRAGQLLASLSNLCRCRHYRQRPVLEQPQRADNPEAERALNPRTISEKTMADFARVVKQTRILKRRELLPSPHPDALKDKA